jgi:hypothetical protein
VVKKKFFVRPMPSAIVSKAFADGLLAFAENFQLSAKPGFPVGCGADLHAAATKQTPPNRTS